MATLGPTLADRLRVLGRAAEARRLGELARAAPDLRLLDVGGGTGVFTERYARGFASVTVVEPDPSRVARGRSRRPNLRYVTGEGEALPFEPASFDRVVAVRSVHHMDEPRRFLAEAFRVLAPAGRLVIEEMRPGSWHARLLARCGAHRGHGAHLAEPEEVRIWLEGAGFEVGESFSSRTWYFLAATRPGEPPRPTSPGPGHR